MSCHTIFNSPQNHFVATLKTTYNITFYRQPYETVVIQEFSVASYYIFISHQISVILYFSRTMDVDSNIYVFVLLDLVIDKLINGE